MNKQFKFIVKEVSYEVLAIPTTKSIPKSEQGSYVKEIWARVKWAW